MIATISVCEALLPTTFRRQLPSHSCPATLKLAAIAFGRAGVAGQEGNRIACGPGSFVRVGGEELPGLRARHRFELFAVAVVWAAWVPRPIAYLMALSGLAYLVQGWVVGSEGFSPTQSVAIVLAWVVSLVWMIWLVVVAWRMQDSE